MHLDKFDLNLLVALDALLTERHVTRAAEKLHISQPAMSAALSKLRDYFQDQLLVKVGSALELTPRARELVAEVRELIFQIRTTLRLQSKFDPETDARDIRLLMSDYCTSIFLPAVTRGLLGDAPRVRCLVERLTPDSLTKIDHGIADFCITIEQRELLEDSPTAHSLSGDPLFEDDFVILLDATSHAALEPLTLERFLGLPHIEVRFSHAAFGVVEAALRRQKLTPRLGAVVPSFMEAAGLVAGTHFTTIIPRQLAKLLAPTYGLVIRQPPMELPPLHETLVWHKRNDADPAHTWFRSYLHAMATKLDFAVGASLAGTVRTSLGVIG